MRSSNSQLAKDWIIKSENDLKTAEILHKQKGPLDSLFFHCHQATEKGLKGFLVFNKKEFPKVHDLTLLLNLCKKTDKDFNSLGEKVLFLNKYYIESRYPSEMVIHSQKECAEALKMAREIIEFIKNKVCL